MSAVKDAIEREVAYQYNNTGSVMAANYRNALTRIARLAASEAITHVFHSGLPYTDEEKAADIAAVLGEEVGT